jgi:phage terminase large subunit GpA-like protein
VADEFLSALGSAKAIFNAAFWAGMQPDELLNVSEWADKHRVLSQKASAEPGRWSTDRTPFLRQIMDVLSPMDPTEEAYFMKGAQIGGTECGNNWIGYVIDWAPGPMLCVQPTVDLAKRNSRQRLQPLIEDSPRLRDKVKSAKARDSGNTILEKDFPGGRLVLTGANSAVGLRSMPARYLFLDEEDAYPGDVDGEGDPGALARARTKTFARRKIFHVSTPTFAGRSRIEAGYDSSDRRRYFVPCPHCKEKQHLKWSQITYEVFKNAVGKEEPRGVHYVCEHCKAKIEEHHKTWMLKNGEWRAEFPGVRGGKVAGFHLNSLYSPLGWFSWHDAAQQWLDAQGKPEELRGFINTVLGETWKDRGDAPDWQRLYDRRETYEPGTVPDGVIFLTAGVDVQKDRLECEVVGWGRDKQSWSIDYFVFPGDTATDTPWLELDRLLGKTWKNKVGTEIPIRTLAVDTGYNTQHVYNWVRRYPMNRVMAVKGVDQAALLLGQPTAVDVSIAGKRFRRGLKLWPVGTGVAKGELYSWLKMEAPTDEERAQGKEYPRGFCHFPQYGDEFFKQMTAEQLVVKVVRGHKKYEWEKTRDRNESLDCRVYARAAAAAAGMDRYSDGQWLELANSAGISVAAPEPAPVEKTEKKEPEPPKDPNDKPPAKWGSFLD